MTSAVTTPIRSGFSFAEYLTCLNGIVWREALRFLHQRERFISALVRPLVWLFIFAAGFRQVLGLSIIPPYETYILYEVYIAPGLMAMIQLFNGMQSSLSMVYDREMGNMRTLLVSPLPRWFLLSCKLLAGTAVSLLQVYAFLLIAWFWDIAPPPAGYLTVLPALVLSGLMLGALGMLISSGIKQLENFAGVMNFVIFPMFFASSALYPLWRILESSPMLYYVCLFNPFTHAVELIRFALYGQVNWIVARGRRRLHDRLHGRRNLRLRSIARPDPPRAGRRRGMKYRIAIAVCLAVTATIGFGHAADPRYPDWPCAQAKVPEISLAAVWAGPPLDDVSGKWKDDATVSALVAKAGGKADPARGSAEGDHRISERCSRQDRKRKTAVCRPVRLPQCPALPGHERAGARHPQAARGGRQDPQPTRSPCRLCRVNRRATRRRSTISAISWSGRRASSKTASA